MDPGARAIRSAPLHFPTAAPHRVWCGWASHIENLWRNTEPPKRWHVWPLCLAVGGLFAYELFLFSDAFITRGRVDSGLASGRALVAAFMTPLLALAMARNREWRVDIHVSRQVVLHTATLGRAAVSFSRSRSSACCCAD